MSYPAALETLYGLSWKGIELGLERVRRASARLGRPERAFPCIQVAGTNGKGTVSTVLAHALTDAGLRTGLFTSPHLHRFSERIRVDGREARPEELLPHLETILTLATSTDGVPLTFFEVATLAALRVFREQAVDVAVLEVGLGGRLDATSVAEPVLTAVTSIGFDHTAYLGDTLDAIAREKAAVARPGVPLVLGRLPSEAMRAAMDTAEKAKSTVLRIPEDVSLPDDIVVPWPGAHQRDNVAIAFELYRRFLGGAGNGASRAFSRALESVRLPGRFEILDPGPRFILDGAHNLEAVSGLAAALDHRGEHPDVLLFGALQDKPAKAMLAMLRGRVGQVVLVPPPLARALDPHRLAETGDTVCASVEAGLQRAEAVAGQGGTVLITGSVFTVGAARGRLLGEPSDPPIGM